jgi:hypothetical protein
LKGIRNWAPPQVRNFFSWPKVGYFLDRVVLTNLILLNYAFYMDPYIVLIIVCYNNLK